jgi:hypothetical protein
MSRYHGITDGTYERFVIDAGEVRINYVDETDRGTLVGATRGGSTFTVETEVKDMAVDGAKGPVKGGRRITKVNAKIVANFIEYSTDLFELAMPGSVGRNHPSGSPTHHEITRALQIALADYTDTLVLIGEVSGSSQPIICGIKNALSDGGFEIAAKDNEESVTPVTFTAHFSPTALDNEPWFVRWPEDSDPTTTTTAAV